VNGLFVTGTDTGVGKTVVTAAVALGLRARGIEVGVAKPLQTGAVATDPTGDAALLAGWLGLAESPQEICPFSFTLPVAPLIAARMEARELTLDEVVEELRRVAARHEALLVEGVGGLVVPLGPDWDVAKLAAVLGLPLLVVARRGLGTVNHTLLTVTTARARGLEVAGVILNGRRDEQDASVETNAELIASLGDVHVLGEIPWLEGDITGDRLLALAQEHLDLDPLLAVLKDATRA
jgi:dethiobiotin synthetase